MKINNFLFAENERGISLFETLIALVLTGTTLISLVLLASKSYKIVNITRVEDTATQLADKGLECAMAFRGGGVFAIQINDNCLNIVNPAVTPSPGGADVKTTASINSQSGSEVKYIVEWGCKQTTQPNPALGTTRTLQTLQTKVTLDSSNDALKSTTGKPICALLETVIQDSGPGGIYTSCNNPLPACL
ncbi:hypothetical protein KC660_00410 [Candidatus Dojkabacteria bacterium]|uniref:Uncharacterized protein n=1 Tax=Candidatus Dojkabacteria bacterium TaxID=2099670 RepID=A0A955RHZ7_9BACT|nr:hypothetical protein [Candidatus Dojkabacteria bacterium]